jgi:hypothetical protein
VTTEGIRVSCKACFPYARPAKRERFVIPNPRICPLPKVEPEPVYGISLNMEWTSCYLRTLCVLISIFPTADKTNLKAVRTSEMGMAVYYSEILSAIWFINAQVLSRCGVAYAIKRIKTFTYLKINNSYVLLSCFDYTRLRHIEECFYMAFRS